MKITENFTYAELVKTCTGLSNQPNNEQFQNLVLLARNVLQPLRTLIGRPIIINSAFRTEAVNKAVGGSSTSWHLQGLAADIRCATKQDTTMLADICAILRDVNAPLYEIIIHRDANNVPTFIHFALRMQRSLSK